MAVGSPGVGVMVGGRGVKVTVGGKSVGAMPRVGEPGIGSTLSGVILGVGVSFGRGVRVGGRLGDGSTVGVSGAPHRPAAALLAHEVRIRLMIVRCRKMRNLAMIMFRL